MRKDTEEIYHKKINLIIDHISTHLHRSLTLDSMAEIAGVSQRHLLRIMSTHLNESLYAYIARQRMERAVMYMQVEPLSLNDLAEKVGYNNAQSFSKAFKKQFSISPKAYQVHLEKKLRDAIQPSINKGGNLHTEIIIIEEIQLIYIRIMGKYGEEESYKKAWNKLTLFLKANRALNEKTRFIGISFDDPNVTLHNHCRFYACGSISAPFPLKSEFGNINIPKGKYAVYTLKGSYSQLQEFYNTMSLAPAYKLRHGIAFEEYINSPCNTQEKELITKVYIPIK